MFTEREKKPVVPGEVNVVVETPEIPQHIEGVDGVQAVYHRQNPVVISDAGQAPTGQTSQPTLTLPADPQVLQNQAKKGNIVDAATWLAAFWFRMFKKALHFGWKVERK